MNKGKKIQVNFLPIVVIICLSIFAGYITAKYVVYPFLGYEPAGLSLTKEKPETEKTKPTKAATKETTAPTKETTGATKSNVVEDEADVEKEKGYALQFGSYSTKEAAKKGVKDLKASGIKAKIVKKDGTYKVIGQLFKTKSKAKKELKKMDKSVGAFVTTIN